jgi:hypothetical protein
VPDSPTETVRATGAEVSAATRALCQVWPSSDDRPLVVARLEAALRRHVLALTTTGIPKALARDATRVLVRHAAEEATRPRAERVDPIVETADRILAQLAA